MEGYVRTELKVRLTSHERAKKQKGQEGYPEEDKPSHCDARPHSRVPRDLRSSSFSNRTPSDFAVIDDEHDSSGSCPQWVESGHPGCHVVGMLEGRDWYRVEGASAQTIEDLRAAAPMLPQSYLHLLSVSNGGEGPLPVDPFNLCLDPAESVISRLAGQAAFDGYLIFGGNGGGEYLALDTRTGTSWPIVTIDMVAGPASAKPVASDFNSFVDLIGIEPPNA